MADSTGPVTLTDGQAAPAPVEGTTGVAPEVSSGQAPADTGQGQAQAAPATPEEPSFFDPNQIPEELKPAYKQMQSAFTKKMQGLSGEKQKIEAYNSFMADPIGQMQQVARQYGYQLTRAEAAQAINQQQSQQPAQSWEPQSWEEVMTQAEQRAEQRIMERLQPVIGNLQKVTASNIERQLQEIDPGWATYQDDMSANLQKYPGLVNDVEALYKLSVPNDVLQSRAVQTALQKFQSKTEQAKVSSSSKTSRSEPAIPDMTKMKSGDAFQAAVDLAKKMIASGG